MDEHKKEARPAQVGSGNPRVTVAFPFAKIQISEPAPAVTELAALVRRLADQLASLAAELSAEQADEAKELAAEAAGLAERLAA